MMSPLSYLLLTLVLLIDGAESRATDGKRKLLIVSFDGFRYNYFDIFKPPNFIKFAESGVRSSMGMKASFPTKTFPNHYTLATGLYPESHGIVDNTFYDSEFQQNFTVKDQASVGKWFDAAEPIWITGRLQGLKTAAYYWFGSEAPIKNLTANYYQSYDKSVSWDKRIATVVDWFDTKDVSLVALYFEEPDGAGHRNGSFSEGVRLQIETLDKTLGQLLEQLEKKKLRDEMDIILLSDHGMTNVSQDPSENLILSKVRENIDMIVQKGPIASIFPKEGKEVEVRDQLGKVTPNVKVYLKNEIPEEFHYRNNKRIAPIIAIAEKGYQAVVSEDDLAGTIGNHGYNNSLPSMWPFFMASGPSFKKGLVFDKQFENVNIYPLMCHILGLKPSANNGSIENVRHILYSAAVKIVDTNVYVLLFCTFSWYFRKTLFNDIN